MKQFSHGFLRRAAAGLLAAAMLLTLGGCGGQKNKQKLTLDLSGKMATLDPLLASTDSEITLLNNCMEGLLRQLPNGTLTEGVAKDYNVSADGMTLTFHLRENAAWSDGTPLTADDFVFAFERLFAGNGGDAVKKEYAAISASGGVTAPDSHTLVIRLSRSDPLMLQKLCQPPAYPCNRGYYAGTHSRYGTKLDYIIFNGPFAIKSWKSDVITLTANDHYSGATPPQVGGAQCYLGREDALERFKNGETDFYAVDYTTAESLSEGRSTILSYQNGMVDLLLNNKAGTATENADLRRALCLSVELQAYVEDRLPPYCDYTASLAPASARVFNESYYDLLKKGFALGSVTYSSGQTVTDARFSNQIGITYDHAAAAAALAASGFTDASKLTILLPKDSEYLGFAGFLQKQWYDNLKIFVNLETVEPEEYKKRIASGDFTVTVYSYAAGDSLDSIFRGFVTGNSMPVTLDDSRVTQLLDQAAGASNIAEAVRYYANAEALLLGHYDVLPVATSSSYYALRRGVTGIDVSSDGKHLFFASAKVA